jgi:hypothetical protein
VLYLGFAKERVKRQFLISNISAGNIMLYGGQHVANELLCMIFMVKFLTVFSGLPAFKILYETGYEDFYSSDDEDFCLLTYDVIFFSHYP